MNVEEIQFKLCSDISSLPPEVALNIVQKSIQEIYDEYSWGFLYERSFIRTPAMIQTSSVGVTKFSTSVIVSSAVKTILDAISVDDVPLIGRQFRSFGGQFAGSNFIYTITNYNSGTSTLTIDPFYQDQTNATQQYQIFKNLYTAPNLIINDSNGNEIFNGIDFREFEWIYAPFSYRKLWLDRTRADLDNRDFARWNSGDPFWAVGYGLDSNQEHLFEFYPIPITERVYQVLYRKGGRLLEPEEEIPKSLNYDLILAKAKPKADEWLIRNGSKVNDKVSPAVYLQLVALSSNSRSLNGYDYLLELAKKKDNQLYPQSIVNMGDSWNYYDDAWLDNRETILLDF